MDALSLCTAAERGAGRLGRSQCLDGPCGGDERRANISSRKNSRAAELARRASRRRPFALSSTTGFWKRATIPSDAGIERLRVAASDKSFAYALDLTATGPVVLQGEGGYSRKSEAGQASYYYSQPFFRAEGSLSMNGRKIQVSGRAWMDREWSSQPLGADQKGWDWFSLHLEGGARLMLYRMRSVEAAPFLFGNWIDADGATSILAREDIFLEPLETIRIADRDVPIRWLVKIKSRDVDIETRPLNPRSWMGTDFAYWEGPIRFTGSHSGEGYLEMTGY